MAISLIDNLKIQNKKQNVERDSFATILDMVSYSPNYLPNIFHAMCEETGKMYVYNVNNDIDPVLGRWRVLEGSGGGTADVPIEKISELTKSDIEALVNLTPEQITNLQSLIDDASISTTHTNSSSHIYMAIQDAIAECKDDTIKQIAKKVSGSYKIANTTADIVSADYIYLLSNGTNYDLYVLVDGTATKVGDTNIDLSEYIKATDLADYMKTSDADGKFATITTVDGKVDKTDIITALGSSATDEQVYSAKVVNAELDNKVDITDFDTLKTTVDEKANKDDINNYSTNERVIGTWIDGKPIYRIYVSFPICELKPNVWNIVNSLSIMGIDEIIDARAKRDADNSIIQLAVRSSGTSIEVNPSTNFSIDKLILEYTKQ